MMVAHGFNILYGQIDCRRSVDVSMIARRARRTWCGDQYVDGQRRAGAVAVHQDASGNALRQRWRTARASAARGRASIETNIKDETETDHFGEQAVLCGGVRALVTTGLRDAGGGRLRPGARYFECSTS